jgi:hypothetical protein
VLIDVGVGFVGLRWGGARGLPLVSYWVVGSDASWTVREPSLQRRIRAFDCSSEGFEGERRHLSVVMAVLYGENVVEGVLLW